MKVSFLVTYYNQKEYVAESLRSIYNLRMPVDYEILAGDDGSEDGTLEEVEKWREYFGNKLRVFVMHRIVGEEYNPVIRASNLRKYLLQESTGDYFCILDGDDYYCDRNFIVDAMQIYEKETDISAVMFNYQMVYPGRIQNVLPLPKEGLMENSEYIREYYRPAGTCVFKKYTNPDFRERIAKALYYDDNDITICNLRYGKLWYIERAIYSYRQHAESIWNGLNRAQQGILNLLGADNEVSLAPEYAEDIYFRFRTDILYAYFRRFRPDKRIGSDFYKEYLSLCREKYISKTLLEYWAATTEAKNTSEEVINHLREQDPDTYYRIEKTEMLDYESMLLTESSIDMRLRQKKLAGEKIRVLFICHRPEVWNSLKTVYRAFCADAAFEVIVLAIPNKKQLPEKGLNHEEYESEGAEEFWKECGCIAGYDYQNNKWTDPKDLHPDYVFFQQPYNIARPAAYKSWRVAGYAKLCYVSYGYQIAGGEIFDSVYPADFLLSTSFYFASDQLHYEDMSRWMDNIGDRLTRMYITGLPRFDLISARENEEIKDIFHALWIPRWCTSENNSFFFEYKDRLLLYCDQHGSFSLMFRPHPQAFLEWNATGEMTEEEAAAYRLEYEKRENAEIDVEKDYLVAFDKSDCLIADMTSLMAEYFLTEKPIIYCHRVDCFTEAGRKLAEGFYWVRTWEELSQTLDMLRSGKDPLKEKREKLIQDFFRYQDKRAGERIKEIIKQDALK